MDITYLGHSAFKIKGKVGTVVADPYNSYVGFDLPSVSADVVTVSHDHKDHNEINKVKGTARRAKPFVIDTPGEYEVGDISVFGVKTWHDANQGAERGPNTVFNIVVDGMSVCHLGDLGHPLSEEQLTEIGEVDILLCPVGGVFTINPAQAVKVIQSLDPAILVPMHFKTDQHDQNVFGELATVDDFLKEYGVDVAPVAKLSIASKDKLPEESEVVVLVP